MKLFFSKNKAYFFLAFVFGISELIVQPFGEYPLNDDWTYAKSLLNLFLHNNYNIGTSSSTLLVHLIYGFFFVKIFGFSFMVLRVSTLISSLIGIFLLFKLVNQITQQKAVALLAALTLLFNPIYFNLSNTYMTDVNFNTLLIACCFFGYQFYTSFNKKHFVLFFLCSVLLVLIRQLGIIIPFSFMLAAFFVKQTQFRVRLWAVLSFSTILILFKLYESFLQHTHSVDAGYPFAGKISLMDFDFWSRSFVSFKLRISTIIVYTIVFSFPFVGIYFFSIVKKLSKWSVLVLFVSSVLTAYFAFSNTRFLMGNIFTNMQVGAETFYENLSATSRINQSFTEEPYFAILINCVKYVCLTLFVFMTYSILVIRLKQNTVFKITPLFIWTSSGILGYIFLLIISDMYFDRYHLSLITVVILAFSYINRFNTPYPKFSWVYLVPLFYISVFGTKDYFTLNNAKWEAYHYLRYEQNVPIDKINAGYEVNCWYDGKPSIYWASVFLDPYSYLIQHRKEQDFEILREYEFQKYFPYKKDKIYIFVRQEKKVGL